jgi:hypothetical protein
MFNSPIEFCKLRQAYVAIDQTQHECALEHGCEPRTKCPLKAVFARGEPVDLRRIYAVTGA